MIPKLSDNSLDSRKRLAVIPARGGSKRIPGKNLIEIGGQPIINYAINAALNSNLFQKILISSDDHLIIEHAKNFRNLSVNKRPSELSNDQAPVYATIKYEYEREILSGSFFDEVWLISATACLLEPLDLRRMALQFQSYPIKNAILGVTEYPVPVQWAMEINEFGNLDSLDFDSFQKASQNLKKYYHDTGCLAAFLPNAFSLFPNGIPQGNFAPFIIEKHKAIDIDNPEDLKLAEALLHLSQRSL